MDIHIDIVLKISISISIRTILKISISIREFCKISISMKYCIDKDLAYRTPLCDDENVVLKDLIIFADDDHGVLVSIAPPILFITIMMVTMKVMIRISFRMFDDRVTVIFTSALLVSSASTMLVFQPAILKHYHTQGQSSIRCGVSSQRNFCHFFGS